MSGEMQKWALWCARRGFRVFRLKPGDRTPAYKGWQGEATTDEAAIQRLWNGTEYNVGVATGDGLAVIDVDVKDGRPGEDTFAGLGLPDDTFVVRTPSGGRHLYFRVPDDVRNSVQRLGPGVDVRGIGGYVVGPGSVVGDRQYDVANRGDVRALDEGRLPAVTARAVAGDVVVPAALLDTPEAVDRAVVYLARDAPLAVEGDGGDHTTYQVACRLKDFGLSRFSVWDLLMEHWNPRCSPPWEADDLERKVQNAFAYGLEPPGSDAPEATFVGVHVEPPKRAGRAWHYHGEAASLDETWLFHQLLPAAGVAVFVGPTGSGKTFLMTEMARCVAQPRPFFGTTVEEPGGSIFLFAGTEGSGFPQRLMALEEQDHLPIAYTHVGSLREKDALTNLLEDLKAEQAWMLEQYRMPLKVVFLETLSASGLLSNENDNAEAAQAMNNLATIGRALGVLVVTTHHPPKHGAGTRGAEAIPSSADYVIEIGRNGKSKVREVALTKARNAEERRIGTFSLAPVEIGTDKKGRPVVSMAVSMGGSPVDDLKGKAAELLIECVEHALLDTDADVQLMDGDKAVDRDDVYGLFKLRWAGSKANTKRSFDAALERTEQAGVVKAIAWAGKTYLQPRSVT